MAKNKITQPAAAYPSRSTSLLERLHHTAEHANGNGHFSGSQVKLQILVVGAGLGGLATAVALARQGHEVTVLEQAAVLGEVGAGIQIPSNSCRLLLKWGLGPYLEQYAVKPDSMTFRRWENGDPIAYTRLSPDFETRYGAPYFVIHRADFHRALCRRAENLGVQIVTDSRVTDYDESIPSATTFDGREYRADLVIAADGVKSQARSVVLGGPDLPPQKTGFAAYRATVNTEEMERDEDTAWLLEKPGINIWIGEDRHVMTYSIAGGNSFNMVLSHVDHSSPSTWNAENAIRDMQDSFKDWDPKLFKVIKMIKSTLKWPLMSGSRLQTWISRSQKLLILGDAAHAMVPYMSQGAAMAVEDGAALATAISKIKCKDQVTTALHIFEKERMNRSYGMQSASLVNGKLWHFPDGPLQQARDLGMRAEVEGRPFVESTNQWSDPVTQIWAYGYDAEDAIDELWQSEGEAIHLDRPQLEKLLQTSDIGSKIDALERHTSLSIRKSPAANTVQSKQQTLQLDRKFEFGNANPFHTGINAPTRFDAEVGSCLVRGDVPLELDGTFYRVACDPIFANRNGKDIWINRDGAINAWRFSNGVVDFKQKYVRTPRFVFERAAREPLFGTYRNPYAGDERVFDEDPDTLDTIGIYGFEGQLSPAETFTAHPKVYAVSGDTMCYSMEASGMGSNDLAYYRFDKHGKKVDECWVKTPDVTWTHDMVATENWVIFHMSNYQFDLDYMKKENGTHFRMNRFLPNRFGVLPRRNPKPEDVRWFDSLKNHTWGHFSNGFEVQDGCIYLDAFIADTDTLGVFPNMHPELDIGNPEKRLNGKLARFKIDPKAGSNELELPVVLSEVAGEMGRCDDRFITRPYNNAFGARHSPRGFNAVIHVDIVAGVTNIWEPGEGIAVGEPCFVPRQKDSPEGDGYLLVCTRDAAKRQAQLSILDATNIIAGPVCIVELPFQLCEGVHGNWVETQNLVSRKPLIDYSGVTKAIQEKFGTGAPKFYDNFIGKPVILTRAEAVPTPRLI